jgi:molybdopterin/thiamine biosynthesis adenylyltransferase
MNYSRQKEIFDNKKMENMPIHIIGAGATGSWLTMVLVKLGCQNINVYDFDVIEEHNIPNQLFFKKDIGKFKVDALKEMCDEFGEHPITVHKHEVTPESGHSFSGIVFVLTDTMKSRKEIWEKMIKYKPAINLMIETRMGKSTGEIHVINPMDTTQAAKYAETLFDDSQAVVSACGTSQSVAPTANIIANYAIWQLIMFVNEDFTIVEDMQNKIIIDIMFGNVYNFKY